MDVSIMELLHKVTAVELLVATVLVIAVLIVLNSQKDKIKKGLNKWRKTKNEQEDFVDMVYSLKDSIESLQDTMKTYQQNRESDRETSRRIREEMYEVIRAQADGLKELKQITLEIQEKNSKTKRAEIKEKIERMYRECHPSMSCTSMQYETLRELIVEYEEHGGKNSFVHSIVEPEMINWKRVTSLSGNEEE